MDEHRDNSITVLVVDDQAPFRTAAKAVVGTRAGNGTTLSA